VLLSVCILDLALKFFNFGKEFVPEEPHLELALANFAYEPLHKSIAIDHIIIFLFFRLFTRG
jgi:hypothetical protein